MGADAFVDAFSAFLMREEITGFSPTDCQVEPEFSWRGCDCCDSSLGGDRYAVSAFHAASHEILEFSVCTDCMLFAANGDLPEAWESGKDVR